jgi:hypothetical protein
MTLHDLAGRLDGYSTSTLSAIENDQQKNPLSPADMVTISDATHDREMLDEYCLACPIRDRIIVRKFPPLNNILPGAQISTMKVTQKLAEASDALQGMLPKLLRKDFNQDPDFLEYRNAAILKLLDVKRGTEILLDELIRGGVVTSDELRTLQTEQQRLCEQHGHHIPKVTEINRL